MEPTNGLTVVHKHGALLPGTYYVCFIGVDSRGSWSRVAPYSVKWALGELSNIHPVIYFTFSPGWANSRISLSAMAALKDSGAALRLRGVAILSRPGSVPVSMTVVYLPSLFSC